MKTAMHVDQQYPVAVFLGPSMPTTEASRILPANYFPPVELGDLYKLLATTIESVLIIDGLFDGSTPVWHREILAVLESGRRVFGASSMGALRAAELLPYGMHGHGRIFEWYRDGFLDGDDEVALFHSDEHSGFLKISEPLVNIRYNLARAQQVGLLNHEQHDMLIKHAKSMYFGDRNYDALLSCLEQSGASPMALADFFESEAVDLKQQDAKGLIEAVAADAIAEQERPGGWYQRPLRFGTRMHEVELVHGAALMPDGGIVAHQDLIARLAQQWERHAEALLPEIESFFLVKCLDCGGPVGGDEAEAIAARWCEERGLEEPAGWLRENGLQYDDWIGRVVIEQALLQSLERDIKTTDPLLGALQVWLNEAQLEVFPWLGGRTDAMTAAKIARIARWAAACGYLAPDDWLENITTSSPRVCNDSSQEVQIEIQDVHDAIARYAWLLSMGPAQLGFAFEPVMAVFRRLQMQGRIRELM